MRHERKAPETVNPFEVAKHVRGASFREDPLAGRYEFGDQAPPWKARDPGPSSLSGYEKLYARFEFSFHSGRGLWDFGNDPPPVYRDTAPSVEGSVYDREAIRAFVDANGVTGRQQDVYILVIDPGQMSTRKAAEQLGIDRGEVTTHLRRLNQKARRWKHFQDNGL